MLFQAISCPKEQSKLFLCLKIEGKHTRGYKVPALAKEAVEIAYFTNNSKRKIALNQKKG